MTGDDDTAYWDRYWAHGCLHSCANAFAGNYEGAIREVWRELFGSLPAGARVVDIGTGNGAVLLIGAEVARERGASFDLHGVDLAAIDPPRQAREGRDLLATMTFHRGTSATAMPFDDASVDAVTGQYALEYTPVRETLAEAARSLRDGGRLALILHHRDSVVVETAREELGHAEELFRGGRLLDHAAELVRIVGAAPTPEARRALRDDPRAEAVRAAFNASAEALSQRIRRARSPEFLQSALGMVGQVWERLGERGVAGTLEDLDRIRADLEANEARLRDLVDAALGDEDVERIRADAAAAGFEGPAAAPVLHEGERLMGWSLNLERVPR